MPKAESSDAYLDRVMALAASQAQAGRANHAAAADHGGLNPADQTRAVTTNRAGINTADQTRAVTTNRVGVSVQPRTSPAPEASRLVDQSGPLMLVLRVSPSGEEKVRRDGRVGGKRLSRAIIVGWLPGILLVAGLAWALTNALAQPQLSKPKPAATAPARNAPTETSKQQQQPTMPASTEQALYLIRSTILTLNDANRSGNYTVLRDLAAPDFQSHNTAADLSQSFSDLRRRNFDLYAAALVAPQLTAVPAVDQRGYLHLTGFFPTRPQQIDFDLLFQNVANLWRPYGISISTPEAPSATPSASR
jgi:hypothetical protein